MSSLGGASVPHPTTHETKMSAAGWVILIVSYGLIGVLGYFAILRLFGAI